VRREIVEALIVMAGSLITGGVALCAIQWWGLRVGVGLGMVVGGILLAVFALVVVDVRSSEGVHTGSRPGKG
jgi:hypothetical protein